ncbi:hypothetical protein CR513_09955, partial [Mucuna pruriens]
MGESKGPIQMWVNQMTSNKENVVEHLLASQLDQDIQVFSKEEVDCLRVLLNSTNEPLDSCALTMQSKSYFNIFGLVPQNIKILDFRTTDHMTCFLYILHHILKYPKSNSLLLLMEIMFFLLDLAMPNFITFFRFHCVVQDLTIGRMIRVAKEQDNNTNKEDLPSNQRPILETWVVSQIWLHYKRLGHPLFSLLKTIQFSKHHRAIFSPSYNEILVPFDLIHSYVWGPVSKFISGAMWFVSFIDDCSHVTWIFFMKHKFEVCQIFVDFFHLVKNQFGKSIKRLWSDNGTKFVKLEFSKFLEDDVVHGLTCLNTPQQNEVAKRKNCHLLEVARALIFQMSVPNVYWGETVLTAIYLINRLPTRVLNAYQVVSLGALPLSTLTIYIVRIAKCVFIGYPSNKKGFKCYHPSSRRVFISMDVTFHETKSIFKFKKSPLKNLSLKRPTMKQDKKIDTMKRHEKNSVQLSKLKVSILTNPIGEVTGDMPQVSNPKNPIEDVIDDMPNALRRGKRSCVKYLISHFSFIAAIDAIKTPTSVHEALKDENWRKIQLGRLLTDPKTRWIYTVKCKFGKTFDRYKARLVAKRYTQTYGIDYEETFVLITKMNTLRIILSLVTHFGWNLQQFDD